MQEQAGEEQAQQGGGQGDLQPEDGVQVEIFASNRVGFDTCILVGWGRWRCGTPASHRSAAGGWPRAGTDHTGV